MEMKEIVKKAKKFGINPKKMGKPELIKSIQKKEGNFECFGTAIGSCDQLACCWRDDCIAK